MIATPQQLENRAALGEFYRFVPKSPVENLAFRRRMIEAGDADPAMARALWRMCREDALFYINVFCWTYNPKEHPTSPARPFITYPFQDDMIRTLLASMGRRDVCTAKSRDMGATWGHLLPLEHAWKFYGLQTSLLVSRNDDYVDKSGDPKSLYWKLDFLQKYQPKWLLPKFTRIRKHLENNENESTIDGEASVEELGRGDRRGVILMDERAKIPRGNAIEAATRDTTNCRWNNSTPGGSGGIGGPFYRVAHNPNITQLRIHWSQHPDKNPGMYTSVDGQLIVLDHSLDGQMVELGVDEKGEPKKYRFPGEYPFILDGEDCKTVGYDYRVRHRRVKVRSVWYDGECLRASSKQEIAQELDIDFRMSGWPFFDADVLNDLIERDARPPFLLGDLEPVESEPGFRWTKNGVGPLKLWITPNGYGEFSKRDEFVVSCDVATGKGGEMSSNSTITVADKRTGEKVAAMVTKGMSPEEFAFYVMPVCKWFNNAYLIWEDNGPGGQFGKVIRVEGYANVFYRGDEESDSKRKSRKPGWWSSKKVKPVVLSEYRRALVAGDFINHDELALNEAGEYDMLPDGTIEHNRSRAEDIGPADFGENHGDRVIADALAWRAICDRPRPPKDVQQEPPLEEIPYDTMAHRLTVHDAALAAAEDSWE